jgi:hypothetical protein
LHKSIIEEIEERSKDGQTDIGEARDEYPP